MRVALYARVSMDEGAEDRRYQEPENQLQPLREFASSFGYEIVKEYVDRKSGADANRPEFKEMLNDAMQRKFNGILIWKLDRFSREGITNTLSYIQRLRSRGVWVRSQTESWFDTSDSSGIFEVVVAVMSWAASEERKKISDRTKGGIKRLRAIGQWKGGRPRLCGICGHSHKKGFKCIEPHNEKNKRLVSKMLGEGNKGVFCCL